MDCLKATVPAALYPWRQFWWLYQIYLDKTVLHVRRRWLVTATLASIFALRLIYLRGFYAVACALHIYIVFLIFMFMTPYAVDEYGVPTLPIKGSDEFRPFIRALSEFHLWYAMTKAYIVSITMTFYLICDVPFIWPHLLCFLLLFIIAVILSKTRHIMRHRYLPFTIGKQGQYTVVRNRLQQPAVVVDIAHDKGGIFVITGAVRFMRLILDVKRLLVVPNCRSVGVLVIYCMVTNTLTLIDR